MSTINWDASRYEYELIEKIAERVVGVVTRANLEYTKCQAMMDLIACHANGCPLQLHLLLEAKPADFNHDILGIRFHLDRTTGKLQDSFVPRYAVHEKSAPLW